MTEEQKLNLRMTLAVNLKTENIGVLESVYAWILGPQTTIIPASNFTVVKK